MRIVGVYAFAQVGCILVRCTHVDRIVARQDAVNMVVGRCACENVHFELAPFGVFAFSFVGYSFGYRLGVTRGGEARQTKGVAVVNHLSRFLGGDKIISHIY